MKGVQLTKLAQELNLTNLTPDIDLTEIYVKTAEINRPALQLTGYLEHFANERVQIIGYVEYTYLMQLSMHDMTPDQAKQTSKFLHTISDFERLGDHAVNISRVAQELHEKSRTFSESATYELNVLEKALVEIVDLTVNSFVDEDLETAAKVEPLRELIGILCNDLKLRHIKRLRNGQCDLNTGFAFNDLLTNYERIAAHCSNIAVAILELDSSNFDIHEYTKSVRKLKDETYLTAFEEYEKKYDINGYQPEAEADKKISVKAKDKDNEKSSGKKKDKDKKKDKKK